MKRASLFLMGLLWYVAAFLVIGIIVDGLKNCVTQTDLNNFGMDFLGFYLLNLLLCVWQALFIWLTEKLYDHALSCPVSLFDFIHHKSYFAVVICILLSPLIILLSLFLTLKPMWWLLRHNPDNY